MLVPMNVILQDAMQHGYGVAAPNVINLETIGGAFAAADEVKAPLIIDCAERFDLEAVAEITKLYAARFPHVPAALNLDHGKAYASAVRAIRAGYTSVMVDRSQAVLADNIRETQEIVKMAHAVGVAVEAELGHVGMGIQYEHDEAAVLTRVDEAVQFVRETGVDSLAVAIGTAHGRYVGIPKLDFERLSAIRKAVHVPLVLHGGSSTGDENLAKAVQLGINKVNVATDLFTAGIKQMKEYLAGEEYPVLFDACQHTLMGYKDMLKHYMILFHCDNRY